MCFFIREIYYQNVVTISNQRVVDDVIDNISCMLGVAPWEFGVVASSKGLVYGNLNIFYSSDEIMNCNIPGGKTYCNS